MTTFVALLRGINVSGRNKVPMAELRALCSELGYTDVQTYIQSGNVVFAGSGHAAAVEVAMERALESRFSFAVPVIVRTAEQWAAYVKTNPFPAQSRAEPNHVLLGLPKSRPATGAVTALRERAAAGEQIERVGDALWIFFAGGVGTSKLTSAVIDRAVGSAVTARNWRTVEQLGAMARAAQKSEG